MTCGSAIARTYQLTEPTTNDVYPYGVGPWMTISIDDVGINQIGIRIQSELMNTSEFYSSVKFDFSNMDSRNFTSSSYTQMGVFDQPMFILDNDHIIFNFETSGSKKGTKRFNNDDMSYYVLNYNGPGSVTSENITNPIAHVQGIDGCLSAKLGSTIPEPSTLGYGLLGCLYILRRKK
jgi:hypothetical protein